jgi:dephospho-CoA kinase
MKIIGLTGGIGSGKTLISEIFKNLNIPVYNSDIEAKQLMNQNHIIKVKLIEKFGTNIYIKDVLNRKLLSSIIFENNKYLEYVNSVVHPEVKKHFSEWVNTKCSDYVIKETAILFESGAYTDTDLIITVTAPAEIRINRVMQRDDITRNEVLLRMKNQISDEERIEKSDLTIINDGKQLLLPQIINIHHNILTI